VAIIAICRGTKSGGQALAECLAERLHYPVLGREILLNAATRLGVSVELLEHKMTGRPALWSRFSALRRTYITAVQAALAEEAAAGDLVYHGLAGGLLLRSVPATLRVRLIAPMARRVEAAMRELKMDAASAEAYLRDLDAARARWVEVMYGENIMNPALYDLVLNLETMSVEGACAVVAALVARPEFALTDEVRARLEDFRMACRVKVALVSDPGLRPLELDAEAVQGVVKITGEAPVLKTGEAGARIVELARTVPGVREVRLKVEWFDPYP